MTFDNYSNYDEYDNPAGGRGREDEEPDGLNQVIVDADVSPIKVSRETFIDEIQIMTGLLPVPEFADLWYADYKASQSDLVSFITDMNLQDLEVWRWAESGDPAPRTEVEDDHS